MKKLLSLLLAGAMSLAMLAACGSTTDPSSTNSASKSDSSSGELQVGVVLPTNTEPRWLQDEAQFESILDKSGLDYEILFSQGKSETERSNVETLVSKGIEILILCPQDAASAADAASYAKDNDVTVISYDRLITGTDAVDYYVTFDSVAVGEAQGQYLVDKALEAGTKGNNLYLYAGAVSDNNAFLFFQGAWSVLQPYIADGTFVIQNSSEAVSLQDEPDLNPDTMRDEMSTIMNQITTDWDESVAKSRAESNLSAVGDDAKGTCYILSPNDPGARNIADVFSADSAVTDYVITGQDAEISSIEYIIEGKQSMTVFKNTNVLATQTAELAALLLDGKTPSNATASYNNGNIDVPSIQSEIIVVTDENVKEALIDSGYYEESQISNIDDAKG